MAEHRENPTEFAVVWPLAKEGNLDLEASARPSSLDGKRVAFIWDYIFRGDIMFDIIQKELRAHYSDLTFIGYDEFGNMHGKDERAVMAALGARLAAHSVDLAIVGVGA